MKVYFLSGLGADEKAFQALELPDVERVYLNWIVPVKGESIESYAKRMAERIAEPDPIIIGLSFGGMVAIEIAKLIPVKKLILISSAKGKKELPPYFTICRYFPLHRFLPLSLISSNEKMMFYVFGTRNEEQKKNLVAIIKGSVEGFNKWAINRIVSWRNTETPANVYHIHGNADRLLPYRFVHPDFTITNGGHFMVVNQAKEISGILQKLIVS